MNEKLTPEERKRQRLENLRKAREIAKAKREEIKRKVDAGELELSEVQRKPKRPKNLDKIVREILDDETIIDKVVQNQPEYWSRLPSKNGGYVIATVMMVKAMGGDIKAAEWIRKTGYGDKVLLESDNGFFNKSEFTIHVVPTKELEQGDSTPKIVGNEIKQIEE